MIEFTADRFQEVCASAVVSERIGAMEDERREAASKFWKRLLIGLALSGAVLWSLIASGWVAVAVAGFLAVVVGTIIVSILPLLKAKEGLKHPVLEEIAKQAGMEYLPNAFEPPIFASARKLLFGGSGFSSAAFTDLFNGTDEAGKGYAVYESCLQRRSGKNSYVVFSGQMYAIQRRSPGSGHTVIVPDKKIFNFWKPASDMERVKVEGDAEFERRFEIYSTEPMAAKMLVDADLRRLFLGFRESGRVFAFVGPEEVLVCISGKDRFEPGSMLRSRPGQERVRMMFDDVCASLTVLKQLKAKFG